MIQRKVYSVFLIIALVVSISLQADTCSTTCTICSHSAFIPRPFSQNSMLELSLQDYDLLHYYPGIAYECCPWITLQGSIFYFQSTKRVDIAEYFLPGCDECMRVGQNNTSDISSPWFTITRPDDDPFTSKYCIEPQRIAAGGALKWYMDFSFLWQDTQDCWYKNWWVSIFMPIVYVRHSLNPDELLTSGQGTTQGSFATVTQALNNPDWRFGKVPCKSQTKTGIDGINIKLGLNIIDTACGHVGAYSIFFAPTSSGTKSRTLFEPLVGTNHAGLGAGLNIDYRLSVNEVNSFTLLADIRYAYFFKKQEVRSIDLFNGDWSRYILVATDAQRSVPLPGINFFTQHVDITPRGNLDAWIALHYQECDWDFELGYDCWWRQSEKIALRCACPPVAIYDVVGDPKISASQAKICQAVAGDDAPPSDLVFTPVSCKQPQLNDDCCTTLAAHASVLNLESAASPRALTNTVYGAFGYHFLLYCENPMHIGLGGSYEFAHTDSALSQAGLWLKGSISF